MVFVDFFKLVRKKLSIFTQYDLKDLITNAEKYYAAKSNRHKLRNFPSFRFGKERRGYNPCSCTKFRVCPFH